MNEDRGSVDMLKIETSLTVLQLLVLQKVICFLTSQPLDLLYRFALLEQTNFPKYLPYQH